MRFNLVPAACVAAVATSLLLGSSASAQVLNSVTLINSTGHTITDFHGTFTGTGGSVANPTSSINGAVLSMSGGNTVNIDFGATGIAANSNIDFAFNTDFSGMQFNSGTFTTDALPPAQQLAPIPVDVARDKVKLTASPEASPLALMGIGIALAGSVVVRRRTRIA